MRDDSEDLDEYTLAPVKWTWAMVPFTLLSTASGVLDALAGGVGDLALGVASHMKYRNDRETFAREAGLAIERITSE